jgi:NAD(P)-dependent dehydrogenase (short-subunit alcohol dehydrogenase family)
MTSRPVVLVTGAARRVGRAIALDLAGHGFDVAVHYRGSADEAQATAQDCAALGARAQTFQADLSDEAAARALLPAVVQAFGGVDAVVNNASDFAYDDPGSFSYALMAQQWRANTAPAIVLAQALHQHVTARNATGCVVNLLDQKLWNQNPDYFSYTLSKAALEAATTMLAMGLAPAVRVCGVAPGVTLVSGPMDETEFHSAHRMTPLRRSSTPEDIGRAVRFLIESPGITGTTLLVDGGQHLAGQARDVMFLARQEAPGAAAS